MNKYPFIKADYWRGSGNQLVFRTLMEHRAGQVRRRRRFRWEPKTSLTLQKARGSCARYRSPEIVNIRGSEYGQGRLPCTPTAWACRRIAYNTISW